MQVAPVFNLNFLVAWICIAMFDTKLCPQKSLLPNWPRTERSNNQMIIWLSIKVPPLPPHNCTWWELISCENISSQNRIVDSMLTSALPAVSLVFVDVDTQQSVEFAVQHVI